MSFGSKYNRVGATAPVLIAFWLAVAMSDQLEKSAKFIEPHPEPELCVVPYTRCWSLYITLVKSLSETQPDLGVARASVDVHLYDDGRSQSCAVMTAAKARSVVPVGKSLILVPCC